MKPMFLDRVIEQKRAEVDRMAAELPLESMETLVEEAPPPRDFEAALHRPWLAVIAEVKRASPSKGPIRPDLDAGDLARRYQQGGCAAISVLTDRLHFGAGKDDLATVRRSVDVPVLRKDFIISEYQLWEARVMGADAVLLIVAALSVGQLRHLIDRASALGMSALVEVHAAEEVAVALDCGARIIGINNRDLRNLQVDTETVPRLLPIIPEGVTVVAESGISSRSQAAELRRLGVDAVLVGEALVTSRDPATLVRALSVDGGLQR